MNQATVWDNHACMPLDVSQARHFLPQLRRHADAGFNVVSLNVGYDGDDWQNTISMLSLFRSWVTDRPDELILIEQVSDVREAVETGRLGICFDIEGGHALNDSVEMVDLYYRLGVRWMSIAYNLNNSLGGGCQDDDGGLTDFGKQVVDRMNAAGMVVCCSHTGFRTAMDVFERSRYPVIFSHSNPLGLCRHKRNIRDEAIRACAASGGVVGINGIGFFLGDNDASSASIARHVDYVAQLVGPEHVGIALDYVFDEAELQRDLENNVRLFPPDLGYFPGVNLGRPEQLAEIAETLSRMGYGRDDLAGILGGNHLRIAAEVWH